MKSADTLAGRKLQRLLQKKLDEDKPKPYKTNKRLMRKIEKVLRRNNDKA